MTDNAVLNEIGRRIGSLYIALTDAERAANLTERDIVAGYDPGDVRRYGAVGDGTTNDATAIQSAIDVAVASSGSVEVIIPEGIFQVGSRLTVEDSCVIRGLGWGSVLKSTSGGTHIILLVEHPTFGAIDGVRFQDFVVDGNSGGQLDAALVQFNNVRGFVCDHLWVKNGDRVSGSQGVNGINASAGTVGGQGPSGTISNCLLENMSKGAINWTTQASAGAIVNNIIREISGNGSAPGIQVNGGFNGRIIGNYCTECEGPGIYVAAVGTVPPIDSTNTIIANNIVDSCGATSTTLGSGILIANATAEIVGRITITGNIVTNNGNATVGGPGIHVQNTLNVVVSGNFCRNNYYDGILIDDSSYVSITGNRCTGNNVAALAGVAGIRLDDTCAHISIVGNHCSDDKGTKTQEYGIALESGASLTYLTISDNHLEGNKTGPMLADAGAIPCRISMVGEKQTTDGTITTVQYFTMPDNAAFMFRVHALGKKSDASDRAIYSREGLFYRDGGSATQQGSTTTIGTDIESDATWGGATLAVASNAFSVRVTGLAATTIDWRIRIEVHSI